LEIVNSKVRLQAYSLTFIDAFQLIAWTCFAMLLVTAVLSKPPMSFGQLGALPVPRPTSMEGNKP
jgi:hypothetical protein